MIDVCLRGSVCTQVRVRFRMCSFPAYDRLTRTYSSSQVNDTVGKVKVYLHTWTGDIYAQAHALRTGGQLSKGVKNHVENNNK